MYQRILVPFDGSATSFKGLDEAVKIAMLTGARLTLLHVTDDLHHATGFETCAAWTNDVLPQMRKEAARVADAGKARAAAAGVAVEIVTIEDAAARLADVVVEQAEARAADLIVVGTHGRTGIDRMLLGSDAEQILRAANIPILLVRAPVAT